MGWTEERVELLTKLWGDGLSASQIAAQLGGVTRNAVIGKVHRLKLEGRARVVVHTPAAAEAARAKLLPVEEVVVEAAPALEMAARFAASHGMMVRGVSHMHAATALKLEPDLDLEAQVLLEPQRVSAEVVPMSRNLTLVQLSERTCKWPLGDPLLPEFRFCGNHSNDVSPYCAYHARIAFQPVSERRRMR